MPTYNIMLLRFALFLALFGAGNLRAAHGLPMVAKAQTGNDSVYVDLRICIQNACDGAVMSGVPLDIGLPVFVLDDLEKSIDDAGCWRLRGFIPAVYAPVSVAPTLDTDPLNGVDLFDLIAINKHILGLAPLPPFGMIAADANNSRSITTFDIVELRKLLLGTYTVLPNCPAWRFVDSDFVFPNPNNPFQVVFPETKEIPVHNDSVSGDLHFRAVKVGDLNCSAFPGLAPVAEPRTTTTLLLPDMHLQPGMATDVPVFLSDREAWLGVQVGLAFDPMRVGVEAVLPGDLPGWDAHNTAQPHRGVVNLLWYDVAPHAFDPDVPAFFVRLRASEPVSVRDVLRMAADARNEGYTHTGAVRNLHLKFCDAESAGAEIGVVWPNPTSGAARIDLYLDVPGPVVVEVWNAQGQQTWQQYQQVDAGAQRLVLPASAFSGGGMYTWRVSAGSVAKTGKVLVRR